MNRMVLDRVGRPYVIEAVRMLEAGEATVSGIDEALEAAGYALGPLRTLDAMGLDVDLAIDRELVDAYPMAPRFDPPPLQERLVAEGRLGRASGRGFYRYEADGAATPDLESPGGTAPEPAAIIERLELGAVNEAYRVVEEGLASPPAIDDLMRGEGGHPRGPFEIVDELGLRHIVGRLRTLAAATEERSGDQYMVATSLWQMATV
jgi:3-hydroxybutyryl-CoA dehydrogenase